jgi:hypothetical protein
MDGYISKPIATRELYRVVEEFGSMNTGETKDELVLA